MNHLACFAILLVLASALTTGCRQSDRQAAARDGGPSGSTEHDAARSGSDAGAEADSATTQGCEASCAALADRYVGELAGPATTMALAPPACTIVLDADVTFCECGLPSTWECPAVSPRSAACLTEASLQDCDPTDPEVPSCVDRCAPALAAFADELKQPFDAQVVGTTCVAGECRASVDFDGTCREVALRAEADSQAIWVWPVSADDSCASNFCLPIDKCVIPT